MKSKKIKGLLSGTKVILERDIPELNKSRKKRSAGREISLIEALFLVETNKLEVWADKKLDFNDLIKASKDENFYLKYMVYRDLKNRGLIVETGFKFGADFRVYERGVNEHAKYLVNVFPEEYKCSFSELSRAVRLTKGVNKNLILALVDGDGCIIYYLLDLAKL